MSHLSEFLSSLVQEFSGKEFTTEDLVNYVTNGKTKTKKVEKVKKKMKMTSRQYFMTQETDIYKIKVTEQVEKNKAMNIIKKTKDCEQEMLPENFLKVLKSVMDDMSSKDKKILDQKVELYPKFSELIESNIEWNKEHSEEIESGDLDKRSIDPIKISKEKSQNEDSDSD
jgi:Tfp pilus assembly protein PilP